MAKRAEYYQNNFSPFGLCLANTEETDPLFENAYQHEPNYFPKGMPIDILKNEKHPGLPWAFRLPFKGITKPENEPLQHKNGIKFLSRAIFEYTGTADDVFLKAFEGEKQIEFIASDRNYLNLVFDNNQQNKYHQFESLSLQINY